MSPGESRPAVLRAEGLTKRFGALVAVDHVDYTLREAEVAGIIGANGAGKTTLFNLLTGYHMPDEGKVLYEGRDITRSTPQERVALGMMRTFQLTSTFDNLSVVDNLVLTYFRASRRTSLVQLLGNTCRRHRDHERIVRSLDDFDLRQVRDREVRHLSLGEKRRLEIAMAVLAGPKVLFLDEPLAGLAESEIRSILEILRRHAGNQSILMVEHKISHVEHFLERLTVMHEGRIIADGAFEETLAHPEVRRSYWQIQDTAAPSARTT